MNVHLVLGTSTGGVGSHVRDLVRGLVGRGHGVTVWCPQSVADHFAFAAEGADVQPVALADRPRPLDDLATVRALRGGLVGADVVHAHGLRAGGLASLATGGRVPLVVTLHNATPGGRLLGSVYGGLERLVARRADVVLGVSRDLVSRLEALGARDTGLAVVPAPPVRVPERERAAVRAELGIEDDAVALLVSVGRLAPQKDLDTLFRATALLAVDRALHVAVAGEGPQREELAARISREHLPIALLGHRGDIPDLLSAADVVVSTAVWEGQPVWLQEALQHSAAVVATNGGGTGAVLGDAGVLVPVGDARAVAGAVGALLDDPVRRQALRETAGLRAQALPTQDDAVEAVLTAYRRAGGNHPRR